MIDLAIYAGFFVGGIAFQTAYPVLGNAVLDKTKAGFRWVGGLFQSKTKE